MLIQDSCQSYSPSETSLTLPRAVQQTSPRASLTTGSTVNYREDETLEEYSPDICPDISYQLQYVEENHRSLDRPWSIRHTGVYHHHSAKDAFDLFIFLNPMDESVLEQQLAAYTQPGFSQDSLASICAAPMRLHTLPFAAYVHNWRWCLRYWGKQFGERVRTYCPLDIKHIALMNLIRMIRP